MLLEKQNIHQPDFSFLKFCEHQFQINRGVYNTIDLWFYDRGDTDILQRRKKIITFLHFVNQTKRNHGRFGKGGLVNKLTEFSEREKTL